MTLISISRLRSRSSKGEKREKGMGSERGVFEELREGKTSSWSRPAGRPVEVLSPVT